MPSLLIALMMEAVQASEMLVNLYKSTWCYNPADSHHHWLCSAVECYLIFWNAVSTVLVICSHVVRVVWIPSMALKYAVWWQLLYMPHPSHHIELIILKSIWWQVQIMELFSMPFFPTSCHFIPFRSTYSPLLSDILSQSLSFL
jgi:hypothetical protein